MSIVDEKYVSFTTFRANGERKPLPVWIAETGDGLIGFTTGPESWKLRRLRNDPRCELQPCDARGRVTEGSDVVTGTAREATAAEVTAIEGAIKKKYGWAVTLIGVINKVGRLFGRGNTGGAAVIVTLD